MTRLTRLWATVAERYETPVALRAGALGGRFEALFREGVLVVRKSNGVERLVDFDEFRAAWRTIAAGGSDDSLRRITGCGPYLRAVRDDLVASGVDGTAETALVGPDEVSSGEAILLKAATTMAATSRSSRRMLKATTEAGELSQGAEHALAELRELLDLALAERDDGLRENARLVASLEVLDARLKEATERADRLEKLAREAAPSSSSRGTIGARSDVSRDILAAAEVMLASSSAPADLRKGAELAVELARRDPASAAAKARVVTEQLVRREWARVMGGDASSTRKLFGDYARELDGRSEVNGSLLSVKRTLYRVANPGAHELTMSTRLVALIVLVLASVLDAEEPLSPNTDQRVRSAPSSDERSSH